jgi:hypothetical protein
MTHAQLATFILVSIYLLAFVAMFLLVVRQRRWRDITRLGEPATLPADHIEPLRVTVRDMKVGDAAYVDYSECVVNKHNRVFIGWNARLKNESTSWVRPIKRLKKGFSIELEPEDKLRVSKGLWGYYAPVVEVTIKPAAVEASK